jgi:hypothetical protein
LTGTTATPSTVQGTMQQSGPRDERPTDNTAAVAGNGMEGSHTDVNTHSSSLIARGRQNGHHRTDTNMGPAPPSACSPSLYEMTTPPLQTNLGFIHGNLFENADSNYNNNKNKNNNNNNDDDDFDPNKTVYYSKIQNLPTPINSRRPGYNNGDSAEYGMNSPTIGARGATGGGGDSVFSIKEEEHDHDNGNGNESHIDHNDKKTDDNAENSIMSESTREHPLRALFVQKTRRARLPQNRNNILGDTTNVRTTFGEDIETRETSPKRFISEFNAIDRAPSSTFNANQSAEFPHVTKFNTEYSRSIFPPSFKPVDRVVSLPLQSIQALEQERNERNTRECKTECIAPAHELKESSLEDVPSVVQLPKSATTYSVDGTHTLQHWTITYEIGSGSFSKVFLANDGATAIKITDVDFNKQRAEEDADGKGELTSRIQNSLTREIEVLKALQHPNIIKLIGTDYDATLKKTPNRITMAIEYCKGGDLFTFVSEKESLNIKIVRYIFANLVSAISYMHHHDIVHRDIKLENILLKKSPLEIMENIDDYIKNKTPIAVLSDFGLSKKIDPTNPMLTTRCGSEDYVSPELLLGMPYDGKQNDCWSLGVVLYTMLEGRLPFDPLPSERMKMHAHSRRSKPAHRIAMISWAWYNVKSDGSDDMKLAKAVVKSLLAKRNKRATTADFVTSDWCKGYL